jgi:hypothetical protein
MARESYPLPLEAIFKSAKRTGVSAGSRVLDNRRYRPISTVGIFVGNTGQNRYRSVTGTQLVHPLESHWRTALRTYLAIALYMGKTAPPTTHVQKALGSTPGTSVKLLRTF